MKCLFKIFFVFYFLNSCYTPSKEKAVQDDLYALKTKMLELESSVTDHNKSGSQFNQKMASTGSDLEKLQNEVRKLSGELDSMKNQNGETGTPGGDRYEELNKRLQDVEQKQGELLGALERAGLIKKPKKSKKTAPPASSEETSHLKKNQNKKI